MKHLAWLTLIVIAAGLVPSGNVQAATIYFSPSSGSYQVGQSFTISLRVNAAGASINASEATITFSNKVLELQSASSAGSIFSFWAIEPTGSNANARVYYSGGLPSPGYKGSSGTILKMTFKAKAAGSTSLRVSGGKILANDGQGTDVLTGSGSAIITVAAAALSDEPEPSVPVSGAASGPLAVPILRSSSHPQQSQWYTLNRATVSWTSPPGLQAISYELSKSATTVPDDVPEPARTEAVLDLPDDGLWYFHLKAKYASGWSDVGRYRLQRDLTAPEAFTASVVRDRGAVDPSPLIEFVTNDLGSGIDRYTVAVDGAPAAVATSPHQLDQLTNGRHQVTVIAYDRAGNSRQSSIEFSVEGYNPPVITSLTSPVMLLDPVVVTGTAMAGDVVSVFVDHQLAGQTIAGRRDVEAEIAGISVRAPWTVTIDQLLRPGSHVVTAVAASPDGQRSVPSDPGTVLVAGNTLLLGGRPVATIAVVPIVGILTLVLLAILFGTLGFLLRDVQRLRRREQVAEEELETLRHRVMKHQATEAEIEGSLEAIDEELRGRRPLPRRRNRSRRRTDPKS